MFLVANEQDCQCKQGAPSLFFVANEPDYQCNTRSPLYPLCVVLRGKLAGLPNATRSPFYSLFRESASPTWICLIYHISYMCDTATVYSCYRYILSLSSRELMSHRQAARTPPAWAVLVNHYQPVPAVPLQPVPAMPLTMAVPIIDFHDEIIWWRSHQ